MSPARLSRAARREQLVNDHLHLVAKIARSVRAIYTHHIELEELIACGNLGLVKAAAAYKAKRGVFSHFAWFYVRGAMIDAHRRSAYREQTHDSVEQLQEQFGFLESRLATCRRALPDEIASRREQLRLAAGAIAMLPEDQRFVLSRSLDGQDLARTAGERGRSLTWARVKLRAARDAVAAEMRKAA